MISDRDTEHMTRAIELGAKGDPSPNPHVGAVVASRERVLGEGFHAEAGLEHAEIVALAAAGEQARGATLYVTLEPCNHHGRTAPCVDAIIAAGIGRVLIGCRDPNPHVTGGGIGRLLAAGIEVEVGVLEQEAGELIKAWSKYVTEEMSFLSLKLALSLDGRTATRTGASRWISCPESRSRVHSLRARHDAVMVGINTVIADDPRLTVRDAPGRNPVRVVVDSTLRLPQNCQLVASAEQTTTCVVTTFDASRAVAEALEERGVAVIRVPATAEGRCDMRVALRELAAREVVSVICEGGAELAGSLLAAGLPDEMHVFVAPLLLGPRGRPGAVDWAGPESPSDAPRIEPARWELCGSDAYVTGPLVYAKKARTNPGA
ncbi:MAG: bifunctional diaminohydroxyphosphoribosylaminopyrimidine deaminase/5-amino-6-(5-phosphoribosylamino)uracil reductase RibD [Sorangiineae bacterium]|nr:bifunctional diaminohydroxyphosphoribosylaminopyrimidine deaminase/5-amino-6-(5-phosphoribosylamino)uracil reductase RibD [Polyangiaceae bacterium]MEB2321244.1 bifunctional diaminohydroxyphosphoribosylaminopyrimidine deaminase/5-amino-6-(5-phosphoribosylamino)uracil reductase RibD [Sorangiineae bacterium]